MRIANRGTEVKIEVGNLWGCGLQFRGLGAGPEVGFWWRVLAGLGPCGLSRAGIALVLRAREFSQNASEGNPINPAGFPCVGGFIRPG